MGTTAVQLITTLITSLCTVIVAIIAASERKSRKLKATEDELAATRKASEEKARQDQILELTKAISDLRSDIENVNKTMADMSNQIRDMHKLDDDVKNDLKTLRIQQERRAHYAHHLAELVMTLAKGLRDQHLDGNITAAIESFMNYERSQLSEYMGAGNLSIDGSKNESTHT